MPPQNTEFKIEDIVKNPQIGSRFSLKNEAGRTLGYKAIENITPTQGGLKIIQFGGDIDTTGQNVLQGGKQTAIVNAQGQFIDPTGRPTNTPSYWNNPQQGIKLAMDVQKFGTGGPSPIQTSQQQQQQLQGQQTPTQQQSSTYTGVSIVDYLKSIGQASDFASRTRLAQQQGISNYTGTAQQNIQLLGQLNKPVVVQPVAKQLPQQPTQPTKLSPQQLQNLKINNQQQQAQKQQTIQTTQPAQPKQQTTTQPTTPTQPTQQPSFEDYVKQQTGKTTQELNTLNGSQAVIDITKAYNSQYPATQQNAPQSSTYQVKSGDTLSAIARANGVSIDDISGYRSNDPNLIFPGEILSIHKFQPESTIEPTINTNIQGTETTIPTEAPLTETQKGYAGFLAEQMQASLYEQIKKELGVPDNKTKIAESSKALQIIQDEKSDKLADVNSNPWLSDNQRLASLRRLDAKFDARIKNAEEQLDREQKLYDNSVKEAQWKSRLIVDQYNTDREFAYEAKKDAQEAISGTTDIKEYNLAKKQGYGGTFMDYQKEQANLKIPSNSPSNFKPFDMAEGQRILNRYKGVDGYTDPNLYRDMYNMWVNKGGSPQSFIKLYPPIAYINPAPQDIPLPAILRTGLPKLKTGREI